jgi:hypothetical protein
MRGAILPTLSYSIESNVMDALIAFLKANSDTANAFGAVASAAAAILALFVSAISVGISVWAVRSERKHNALSVRPLAEITVADYEDCVRVKLRNHGTGPMLVKAVTVSDGKDAKPSLVDWMPPLKKGRLWNGYAGNVAGRALSPGSEIVLLELEEYEREEGFAVCRDAVRKALTPLTVNVEYTDIYNTVMPPYQKALTWFGRHFG